MLVLSHSLNTILLVELTVPWEENTEWAHERKMLRYEQLVQDCKGRDWRCYAFAVEVGCRGFVGKLTVNLLKRLGSDGRRLRSIINELACTAERSTA